MNAKEERNIGTEETGTPIKCLLSQEVLDQFEVVFKEVEKLVDLHMKNMDKSLEILDSGSDIHSKFQFVCVDEDLREMFKAVCDAKVMLLTTKEELDSVSKETGISIENALMQKMMNSVFELMKR